MKKACGFSSRARFYAFQSDSDERQRQTTPDDTGVNTCVCGGVRRSRMAACSESKVVNDGCQGVV